MTNHDDYVVTPHAAKYIAAWLNSKGYAGLYAENCYFNPLSENLPTQLLSFVAPGIIRHSMDQEGFIHYRIKHLRAFIKFTLHPLCRMLEQQRTKNQRSN
jgi:hypothetical protein